MLQVITQRNSIHHQRTISASLAFGKLDGISMGMFYCGYCSDSKCSYDKYSSKCSYIIVFAKIFVFIYLQKFHTVPKTCIYLPLNVHTPYIFWYFFTSKTSYSLIFSQFFQFQFSYASYDIHFQLSICFLCVLGKPTYVFVLCFRILEILYL